MLLPVAVCLGLGINSVKVLVKSNMKYNIGKGNSLDVLDAETILTAAKLNYSQIVIDLLTTIAELNYNIGSDEIPFSR